ncbi:mediator complex subunit [Lunasporangiospora selenospora]|uniref:Mediator of RNA polymerase II transcription subunit 14 n=1 Tax=Lunasporangiospora selenospora TaxID=979761 RepID=A0A9P6FVJ6_9FUNG|nr:mediator complex subunit [Lunasporangiospora selenospora]
MPVGGLFETYRSFGRARVRNYDVPTAIDILTTGSYQRLPLRIKQAYVEEEKPNRAEIAATLEKLDDVIRMRLLCDELIPPAMRYTVGKGKVKFVVPNEFEVSLTIAGPGSPSEVPWRIVGLKILVKPVGGSFQGLETALNEAQARSIMMAAQRELDPTPPTSTVPTSGVPTASPTPDANAPPANQALLRLYGYLHMLALHLQVELVYIQAYHLLRSGWTDRLRVEINPNRSGVRLVYWHNGFIPQPAPVQTPMPAPKRRTSASALAAAIAKEQAATAQQQEHYIEIKIEEQPSTKIPEGLAGALVDPKVLGYPKAQIKVVWSQVIKNVVTEADVASVLELDASNLNIERLLLRAVSMHTGQVMQGFYDRLWSHIENTKSQSQQMEGAQFSHDDVKLETMSAGEQQALGTSSSSLAGPQVLLVRLKSDRWVRIRIDVRTGRVVVKEVGKTNEGDDLVIASFQARLNENANNIVDALIALRFSMTITELESVGTLLGLQPFRRLALGKQDALQFGANIQHILFLQYPQHPRHYLVVGVIDQKFCVWLIEVAPTDKEVAGIWLTLKSIVPVYWQGLRRPRKAILEDAAPRTAPTKRKSVQFDTEGPSATTSSNDEPTIDQDTLSKLETLCRARICHKEAMIQLQEHGIRFRYLGSSFGQNGDNSKILDGTITPDPIMSLVPLLRLDPSTISAGTVEGMFSFVGAKLSGWWDNKRETCNFVVQAMFMPGIIPPDMATGPLDSGGATYHASSNMLSFVYKARGSFIQQFKEDWDTIVRMLKIIRQLHAPTLTNKHFHLSVCHLHQVQLQYFGKYAITIKWVSPTDQEKKSSTGVTIPCAPRFKQGFYEIDLSVMESKNGRIVNPHQRMKYFLQNLLNREADLHLLMNTIEQMCLVLEVLDRLEDAVKEDNLGTKLLSVVPRAAHHVRVVYGSKFALDIRAYSRTHLSIFDSSFPSESYGAGLPPPPAPTVAPTLLTPGRTIAPTTKGHLHYGPISNLQGIIGAIDVDKDDEEYNQIMANSTSELIRDSQPAPKPLSSADILKRSSLHNAMDQAPPQPSAAAIPSKQIEEEVYQIMPLPNGVVCSRAASGRVFFRIAKHVESLF